MKKGILLTLAAALFAVPAIGLAASYHYVTMEGEIKTIEAANAAQALTIAHQNGAAHDSGVKADQGMLDEGDETGNTYLYVDISGNTKSVTAANVQAAFTLATDIAPDSGVVVIADGE